MTESYFPLASSTQLFRRWSRYLVGYFYSKLVPQRYAELESGNFHGELSRLDRTMIAVLVARGKRKGSLDHLVHFHNQFWASENGSQWHIQSQERFKHWFFGHHKLIVDELEQFLKSHPGTFCQLYEIGCGAGLALEYLDEHLSPLGVSSFTGLDLSPDQTRRNQEQWPSGRRTFITADALSFLPRETNPGSIYIAIGGVMEYIPGPRLQDLYQAIANTKRPAIVALVEPVDPDHNLEIRHESYAFGSELSWSHPHAHYLRSAGYEIVFEQEQVFDNVRWLLLIASAP